MNRFVFVLMAGGLLGSSLLIAQRAPRSGEPQTTSTPASKAADITGNWHFTYQTDGGERESTATFRTDGDQVTGKYGTANVKGTFKDGEMELAFPFNSEEANMTATLKMKGKLKEGRISGNWQFADYEGTFVATRTD